MTGPSNSPNVSEEEESGSWVRGVLFFLAFAVMALVQLFVTFRGLSSPQGMDQAVIARELARGHGYHSEVVRPYAWEQFLHGGHSEAVQSQPDTWEPPLPALTLAPVFRMLKSCWEPIGMDRPYPLDRVVACVAVLFFLAAVGVSYQTAVRLFDERVALWMMVALLFCGSLWDLARSGLGPMMVLFFMSIMLLLLVIGLERVEKDRPLLGIAFLLGLVGAALVLTQWMGIWIVLGFAITAASFLRPRGLVTSLVLVPSFLVLLGWSFRSHAVCGDYIGAQKATLVAMLTPIGDSWILRNFGPVEAPIDVLLLGKKVAGNLAAQISSLAEYMGSPLALVFFISVLHPFKRAKVAAFRWALLLIWLCALIGMAFIGLPEKSADDRQIHFPFLPMMMAYALAFLAVLWSRLAPPGNAWWSRHGAMALGAFISSVLMLATLPQEVTGGMTMNRDFAHWPPYLPGRIAKLRDYTQPEELVLSDAPWAVAWYADRPAVWFPQERAQFRRMQEEAQKVGNHFAGALLTPISVKQNYAGDIFQGEYQNWARVAYAGPIAGFGVDLLAQTDFPFKYPFALAGQMTDDRFAMYIVFLIDADRNRSILEAERERQK